MRVTATESSVKESTAHACPKRAQRKPSTTPTMGFREYSHRQASGTRLVGETTGVTKSQNCVRKGRVYLMSRYLASSAENQKPIPMEARIAIAVKSGRARTAK